MPLALAPALLSATLAIGCFLLGAANPAAVLARILGRDLRSSGSGNPGATNAGRVLGVRWGVVVGLLDVLKGWLPTWWVLRSFGLWPALVCGLALVLGHMFSPFLRGRGGKGVATSLGALLAITPWVALGAVLVFAVFVGVLRTVGEASMLVCAGLVVAGVLALAGVAPGVLGGPVTGGWLVALGVLVLSRHRRNLVIAIERRRRGR